MTYPSPAHDHFVVVDLDQSSDAWLDWRKTGLGSSDAPAVLGDSPWKTRHQLWQEKVVEYHGSRAPITQKQFHAIRKAQAEREGKNESSKNRGKKLEAPARAAVEDLLGLKFDVVCGHHRLREHLKVSLDGWNADRRALLEIKAPNQKAHGQALDGIVVPYYRAQVLHQFLVSGAREAWYVSAHPTYPPGQRIALVHVTPESCARTVGYDSKFDAPLADLVAALGAAEDAFWDMVKSGVYLPEGGEALDEPAAG